MNHERDIQPAFIKPYEAFGLTEKEQIYWRVNKNRFEEILNDEQTLIHEIRDSSNKYGEFFFVTTSRPGDKGRISITFYGLGYHEYRERWIIKEWYWYQTNANQDLFERKVDKGEVQELLKERLEQITPEMQNDTQTERGKLFEMLADLTDEDGALAELEDLESLTIWLDEVDRQIPPEKPPPTGENLLDKGSRDKLPPLYSGEDKGMDALAQVKFFTPDAQWTWYASEFDGEDIFFGLVSGLELEFGYFSLKELQEVKGPMDLHIERDLNFEPKSLRELRDQHKKDRGNY